MARISITSAREWLGANIAQGWASCPITENGCLRIMSQPAYPQAEALANVAARLRRATSTPYHAFWPDSVSALDGDCIDACRIHGPKQLTDIYLLALAVRHGGPFVSFDARIARSAVPAAEVHHLVVL